MMKTCPVSEIVFQIVESQNARKKKLIFAVSAMLVDAPALLCAHDICNPQVQSWPNYILPVMYMYCISVFAMVSQIIQSID